MGLLDNLMDSPEGMGLLSAGIQLMGNRGGNIGQVLAQGLGAGMQGYGNVYAARAERAKMEQDRMLEQEKINMLRIQEKRAQALDARTADFYSLLSPGGNTPQAMPMQRQQIGGAADVALGLDGSALAPVERQIMQQQKGGLSGMTREHFAAALAAGVPNADAMYKMWKDQNEGTALKPGEGRLVNGVEVWNPDNKTGFVGYGPNREILQSPNFNDVEAAKIAAVEAAKARAQSNFELLPPGYVGKDGRPLGLTKGEYISGGQPQALQPVQPQIQRGAMLPQQPSGLDFNSTQGGGLDISRLNPAQIQALQRQDPAAFNRGVNDFNGSPDAGAVSLQGVSPGGREQALIAAKNAMMQGTPDQRDQAKQVYAQMSGGVPLPIMQPVQSQGRPQLQSDVEKEAQIGRVKADNAIYEQTGKASAITDTAKASQLAGFDTMLDTMGRLQNHPGLNRSVGIYSPWPTIPGSDSANFKAELNTFQSQAFIPMVSQLKGMGALSDAEGKKLTQAVGALDPSMSEKAFNGSLSTIMKDMVNARARVSNGGSGGGSGDWENSAQKPKSFTDFGYKNESAAINDARNAILKNPGAKAEILRRLAESGITNSGLN